MTEDTTNKVALVTGGGSGIGEAICLQLADKGIKVIVVDIHETASKTVAEKIVAKGGKAVAYTMDIGELDRIAPTVESLASELGGIDILVNCAGIRHGFTTLLDLDLATWNKTFEVNLNAAMLLSKHCAQTMVDRQSGGWIVNIASAVAFMNGAGGPAYACSKAAMHHLTKVSAAELAQYNINVNSVAPGLVKTPGLITQNPQDQVKPGGVAYNPQQRVNEPEEIADAVMFLISPQAKSITGQVLHISGGGIM